jgi:cytoplasmic iron level regulating protein YaaA (DUF328/UPF0246 family)
LTGSSGCKEQSPKELAELMSISELAEVNWQHNQDWKTWHFTA